MYLKFADANSDFKSSFFVIFGVPFDGTSSYRHGSKFAPYEIRKASYNLESFLLNHKLDLKDVPIHDAGDVGTLDDFGTVEDVIAAVQFRFSTIVDAGKFPIMLGGEHSVTIGTLQTLKSLNAGIVFIDAHADFRDFYLGIRNSHACVARRAYEVLDKKVISIGVRSVSAEEFKFARESNFRWITADEVIKNGWQWAVKEAIEYLNADKIYLSIDIDGIDPAYAPGTGTPEYFGLTPWDVRGIIQALAPKLVGADIVEICPEYDNGNTSVLGAKLVQEIIASVNKSRTR